MSNNFSNPKNNNAPFLKRLWIYQRERFPVFGHVPLVAAFSFSAISYSRICRGAEGFISTGTFIAGILITVSLFLLVRIFDEFKDAEDDRKYRPELPVPRGLISFNELGLMASIITIAQILVNAVFFPNMMTIYCIVLVYLLLMGKEFFIGEWLKKYQFWYVTSHMFIIPLIDIYASGLDWLLEGASAPKGLIFFFIVSYFNGIVLEIGRKIRIPEKESEGVLTYTSMLGKNRAVILWSLILSVTLFAAIAAAWFAGYGNAGLILLSTVFIICLIPAILFLLKSSEKLSKMMEYASALWTIAMYLTLGGIPMIASFLNG